MHHKTHAKDFETEHAKGEVFEAAGDADDDGEDDGPETGADAIDVGDVASVGNGKAVYGLQVVVEG